MAKFYGDGSFKIVRDPMTDDMTFFRQDGTSYVVRPRDLAGTISTKELYWRMQKQIDEMVEISSTTPPSTATKVPEVAVSTKKQFKKIRVDNELRAS